MSLAEIICKNNGNDSSNDGMIRKTVREIDKKKEITKQAKKETKEEAI